MYKIIFICCATLDTLSLIARFLFGRTLSHRRQVSITGVIRISRLDNWWHKQDARHACVRLLTNALGTGQSRPSRAARGASIWRFSPRRLVNQLARLRSVARLRLSPHRCDFRLEDGKIDVKLPCHRPPSVRHLVAASPERFSKRAGPSERHHRPLVAYAAPGRLTGPRTLR